MPNPARTPITISDPGVLLRTEDMVPVEHDITKFVKGASFDIARTEHDVTTAGNDGHRFKRGLETGSVTLNFYSSFAANASYDVFRSLYLNNEYVTFEVWDLETGKGLTGSLLMSKMPSFHTDVDNPNEVSLQFPIDGVVDDFELES